MKDDRITLVYEEGNVRVELGKILADSISVDDALRILNIDMDKVADKRGWDGWDWGALKLVYPTSSDFISLDEYAKLHDKKAVSVRQKAQRGGFATAQKIGRNWVIDKNEPYTDQRKKLE